MNTRAEVRTDWHCLVVGTDIMRGPDAMQAQNNSSASSDLELVRILSINVPAMNPLSCYLGDGPSESQAKKYRIVIVVINTSPHQHQWLVATSCNVL
jgi:hypothetical protein